MKSFRVGIIGTGNIARCIVSTLNKIKGMSAYAVASRSIDRASDFAAKYKLEKYYGSYEEMLQDIMVDMVYIATLNICHYSQAMLCIKYKKPCLVEKPFCMNAKEAKEVLDYAKKSNVFVAEAMLIRYLPELQWMQECIRSGIIGDVKHIWANLCINNLALDRIRKVELGGGALLDLGIYLLHFADAIYDSEIVSLSTDVLKSDSGVDVEDSIFLTYANGSHASLFCAVNYSSNSDAVIFGTKGIIEVKDVYNFSSISVYQGRKLIKKKKKKSRMNGYEYELLACRDAINNGKKECDELPGMVSLNNMELMDKIFEQAGCDYFV